MHFIGDLIDSPLDVDRMDYLARDSHMTGLSIGALNMQALIERVVPFKEVEKDQDQTVKIELAFEKSAVPYIEQFLYARDVMYLNCYERSQKVIAERMLGRAFDEFRKDSEGTRFEAEDLALLTDQQIIELMLAHSGPSTLTCRMIERLMKGVTFEELYNAPIPIKITGPDTLDKLPTAIRGWAEAVLKEDYGGAYLQIPTEWARTLSRRSAVDESQIIVTVPPWSIVDNWLKEGQIRILLEDSGSFSVDHVDKISNVLKDFTPAMARARLTLRIFVDPDLTAQQKEKLLIEAKDLFTASQASS
jgi:HD superfamily phosphohydrolase